jgi:NADH dehydrogenase [ubiquinone] 1 alpha subcomplex assembly factor 1
MNTSLKNHSYVIFDFSDSQTTWVWKPVNDVIMGGRSTGTMKQASPTSGVFAGVVSMEHGGGFASVRTLPTQYNLEGFSGLVLSVRGDGQRYKINLTDKQLSRDVLHQARFETRENETGGGVLA